MNHMTHSALNSARDDAALVTGWLERFEAALGAGDQGKLAALFAPESHWRDLLAKFLQLVNAAGAVHQVRDLFNIGLIRLGHVGQTQKRTGLFWRTIDLYVHLHGRDSPLDGMT
jgi:hypothetical protein